MLVLYVVIQQVENNIIVPNVMARTIGFSPLMALIILFIGGQLFGFVGIILAIPTAIVASIIARDILDWSINHYSPKIKKSR